MQLSPVPQSWPEARLLIIGVIIGLIPSLVNRWLDRKKSSLDNSETEARTQSIIVRDSVAATESVSKMLTTLIEAGDTIKELQERVFELEQNAIADRMIRLSLKRAKALLDFHDIPYSEADEPEVKRIIDSSKQ